MYLQDFWSVVLFVGTLIAAGFGVFAILILLFSMAVMGAERRFRALMLIRQSSLAGVSLAITGVVIGYLAGASRASVVDALIPAVLTFKGGVTIYLTGKGRLSAYRVGFITLTFTVSLMMEVGLGSTVRERYLSESKSVAAMKAQADQEFLISLYRHALGLSPESKPVSMYGSEPE
jgi:hypothetical protein